MEKTPVHLSSSKRMNKRLVEEGVIYRGKEERSASKKICGHRYLELRREDLSAAAKKALG